jgi:hypothetical protein
MPRVQDFSFLRTSNHRGFTQGCPRSGPQLSVASKACSSVRDALEHKRTCGGEWCCGPQRVADVTGFSADPPDALAHGSPQTSMIISKGRVVIVRGSGYGKNRPQISPLRYALSKNISKKGPLPQISPLRSFGAPVEMTKGRRLWSAAAVEGKQAAGLSTSLLRSR